jgi:FixJ family two-component response regulator
MFERFYQLDQDYSRRAGFADLVRQEGVHAEPFERVEELIRFSSRDGIVFVHDRDDQLEDLVRALRDAARYLPIVAYKAEVDAERVVDAMALGAIDYLRWPIERLVLRRRLLRMRQAVAAAAGKERRRVAATRAIATLSPRESQVLALLAGGGTNKAIGRELAISPRTVEIHRANMLDKLGARTTAAAVSIAVEADHVNVCPLDEPPPSPSAATSREGHPSEQSRSR